MSIHINFESLMTNMAISMSPVAYFAMCNRSYKRNKTILILNSKSFGHVPGNISIYLMLCLYILALRQQRCTFKFHVSPSLFASLKWRHRFNLSEKRQKSAVKRETWKSRDVAIGPYTIHSILFVTRFHLLAATQVSFQRINITWDTALVAIDRVQTGALNSLPSFTPWSQVPFNNRL